ncbi:MAG TPA: hypothetical protein VFA55_01095 [Candidatus Kapabacteria bacterium]|nr:hypothetical protein [Candidatus Kapabacteria bacterium]
MFFTAIAFLFLSHPSFSQALESPYNWVIPTNDGLATPAFPNEIEAPAGKHGFLTTIAGGHFQFQDGTPVKFWGTSFILSAVFPDSADAIAQAAHLQKYGFNIVRLYAFDLYWEYGASVNSILVDASRSQTTQEFDQDQLKKLDWFIYQLKLHGVYVDFTFNVYRGFRAGDSVAQWDSVPLGGEIVNYFDARIQQLQQQFEQKLLTHVNPYTQLAYKDDPVVALVEMTNQDPLPAYYFYDYVHRDSTHTTLSYFRSAQLDTLFNAYLTKKYKNTGGLAAAWNVGANPSQAELLPNGSFEQFLTDWAFIAGDGNTASDVLIQGGAPDSNYYMHISITQADSSTYGIYLINTACSAKYDSLYIVTFYAKTTKAGGRSIVLGSNFGLYQTVQLDTGWKQYSYTFRASATYMNGGTLGFYLSSTTGDVLLDGVTLKRKPELGLTSTEKLENTTVQRTTAYERLYLTDNRLRDESLFYDSLARTYCVNVRNFLKNTVGVRVPISGINWELLLSDVPATENMDFVSTATNWDYYKSYTNDSLWVIHNTSILTNPWGPMTAPLVCATKNKPMVICQFYDLYPNKYQTESELYMPAYSALQNYDAIFWYYYAGDKTEFNTRQITQGDNYELMHNPAMMAMMPAASYMFRNGLIAPAQNVTLISHDSNDYLLLPKYVYSRSGYGIIGGLNEGVMFIRGMRLDSLHAKVQHTADEYDYSGTDSSYIQSETQQLNWDYTPGILWIDAPRAQGATGFIHNTLITQTTNLGVTRQDTGNFGTYLWISLDTSVLANAHSSLLALVTSGQNTGTKWNGEGTTINNHWGSAPTQIGSMDLAINFKTNADTLILYPMDTLGRITSQAIGATKNYRGEWRVVIDQTNPLYQTPWFYVQQYFSGDTVTGVAEHGNLPEEYGLSQNSPNPFNDYTSFSVTLPLTNAANAPYSLKVYDYLGKEVADLTSQVSRSGESPVTFLGTSLPSGVYRYVLHTPHGVISKTMMHIK